MGGILIILLVILVFLLATDIYLANKQKKITKRLFEIIPKE